MKRNWIKGIEHFSPFSSLSEVNVSKLKEADYCIETCRIVRSHRLIAEQRFHFAHPFFPEISSSFKAAFCFGGIFCSMKVMRVLSEAPHSFHLLANTWSGVDNTLCSQLTLKSLIFTHKPRHPDSQSAAKYPWLIAFHLLRISHQALRKLPGVLLCPETLNIHLSIISIFNSIKW